MGCLLSSQCNGKVDCQCCGAWVSLSCLKDVVMGSDMKQDQALDIPRDALVAFCRRHHIRKLSLFGSVVRGEASPDSDLDVLVEFEPGWTPGLDFFELQDALSRLFGRTVDLNTPAFLSRHFRNKVLAEAEVQYAAS